MTRDRSRPQRIELDGDHIERGLVELVLAVLELIRQLVEKQALRRVEGGALTPTQIERLGTTLMRLEQEMEALKGRFGIDDLNIDLGPLGTLLDEPGTVRGGPSHPRRAAPPRQRRAEDRRW